MAAESPAHILKAGLEQLGCDLTPDRQRSLEAYLGLLRRWNRTYNLTAIRDPAEMVTRHLLDSLSVSPYIPAGRLLDAGTGAGLPGIPLAIARRELEVTLLDSAGKKIRFLSHVKRSLRLNNISPVQARLEAYETEGCFDAVISRAFSSLAAFAKAARTLLSPTTTLFAMKGRYPASELEALPAWVEVLSVEKLNVPGLQETRHLVIMCVNS
jgi:16S rRNA (guanine527-N7)-methyltransferase